MYQMEHPAEKKAQKYINELKKEFVIDYSTS